MKSLTDMKLVALFKETDDKDYIGELFRRYRHLVLGVCMKYIGHLQTCQDLTMEIFEMILGELPDQDIVCFKPWLYSVARNHCCKFLRDTPTQTVEKKRYEVEMEKGSDLFVESDPFSTLINGEGAEGRMDILKKGLKSLKKGQITCLDLFYVKKLSYEEIAKKTGYELKQVKSHIQNGKRKLRVYLTKNSS